MIFYNVVLLTGCSSARTVVVWDRSTGCCPSGTDCFSGVLHRVSSPANKPALVWTPLHRVTHPVRNLLHYGVSTRGHSFLQGFLLKYIITETLPPSLMGSTLDNGGSVLKVTGTDSVKHEGKLWCLVTEAPPATSLSSQLPKSHHINQIQRLSVLFRRRLRNTSFRS